MVSAHGCINTEMHIAPMHAGLKPTFFLLFLVLKWFSFSLAKSFIFIDEGFSLCSTMLFFPFFGFFSLRKVAPFFRQMVSPSIEKGLSISSKNALPILRERVFCVLLQSALFLFFF